MIVRFILVVVFGICSLSARDFWLVAYNVENLFDADGVSTYDDYSADKYSPRHLLTKLRNAASVLSQTGEKRGPDVLVLNEIELDQTPSNRAASDWLLLAQGKSLAELLPKHAPDPRFVDAPAEFWLAKALEEAGLGSYHIAVPDEKPGLHEDGRPRSVKNVIFSRFPLRETRTHPTADARAILEATLDVDGQPLTVFANHWKSGAGDEDNERIRIENATTLRKRLDAIFSKNPLADVVVAGDLNCHYNQAERYPHFRRTAIGDVLKAAGPKTGLKDGTSDLYNLWFELPPGSRGSDVYRDQWGTLIHLIGSRGLFEKRGVSATPGTFGVVIIRGLNADYLDRPVRWSKGRNPAGYSDHFPVQVGLRTNPVGPSPEWLDLSKPNFVKPADPVRRVSEAEITTRARSNAPLLASPSFDPATHQGEVFLVEAPAQVGDKGYIRVSLGSQSFDVFSHTKSIRDALRNQARSTGRLTFIGELGQFKNRHQFVVHRPDWINPET